MTYLLVLALTLLLIYLTKEYIKKYSGIFYILIIITGTLSVIYNGNPFTNAINIGYPSLTLFIIVMFIGVLDKRKKNNQKLIAIRAQLSIAGFILLLPHAIIETIQYTDEIFTDTGIVIGILAGVVMIPLFITSFMFIRKKMKYQEWKTLHRWSYFVYLATFIHLYLLSGHTDQLLYTLTFGIYSIMRLNKAMSKDNGWKYVLYLIVFVTGIFLIFPSINLSKPSVNLGTAQLKDGTYTGSGVGYHNLPVSISITITNGKLALVRVTDCGCTAYRYQSIVESYAQEIVNEQTLNLDAASGATHSTDGLMQAVTDAINQARS